MERMIYFCMFVCVLSCALIWFALAVRVVFFW